MILCTNSTISYFRAIGRLLCSDHKIIPSIHMIFGCFIGINQIHEFIFHLEAIQPRYISYNGMYEVGCMMVSDIIYGSLYFD